MNRYNYNNDGPPQKMNRFNNPWQDDGPSAPPMLSGKNYNSTGPSFPNERSGNNFNNSSGSSQFGGPSNFDGFNRNCGPSNDNGNGFNRNGGPSNFNGDGFNRDSGPMQQGAIVGALLNKLECLQNSIRDFGGNPQTERCQTVSCGELRDRDHGRFVEIEGKVNRVRGRFLELKDQSGSIQCVASSGDQNMAQRFANIPLDTYCTLVGLVKRRPAKLVNESLPTGGVEVHVRDIFNVRQTRASRASSSGLGSKRQYSTSATVSEKSKSTAITSNEYKRAQGSDNFMQHFTNREHTSDTLRSDDANKVVTLVGWIETKKRQNRRFLYLHDGYGDIQVVLDSDEHRKIHERLTDTDVILVKGLVLARPKVLQNKMSRCGDIEILAESLEILDPNDEYKGTVIEKVSPTPKEDAQMDTESDANERTKADALAITTVNSYTCRSHTCGELTEANVGEKVTLVGWLEYHRMSRFFTLRDGYGRIQIYIPNEVSIVLKDIPFESILLIKGMVLARPTEMRNPKMATGDVEVNLESYEVLNKAMKKLPIHVRDFNRSKENLRMEYRYIDLRFEDMQRNLRMRSAVLMKMREYLCNHAGFVEVETPTLFRKTPGGAQEFLVPTQTPGKFYSLVQSPQQFKQMLMSGAIDRYFQIARCYRDETTRPDRQPEFTQLDIELSFSDRDQIMLLVENILSYCWPDGNKPVTPFERMTYDTAMEKYGCDKPDTRFEMTLNNVTSIVATNANLTQNVNDFAAYAIPFKFESGKRFHDDLADRYNDFVKVFKGKMFNAKIQSDVPQWATKNIGCLSEESALRLATQLGVAKGDRIFLAFGPKEETQLLMGRVRLAIQEQLEDSQKVPIRSNADLKFLWVNDFPMFSLDESGQVNSVHHPFTAPHPDDLDLLHSTKEYPKVRSQAYDLVLNGMEIGGGSIRIHDAELQRNVLNDILKIEHTHLSHLINALDSGCPPHGGIALGIDRLMSIMCNAASMRDVIAFPKGMDYKDPLSKAPVSVSDEELRLYHIDVRKGPETTAEPMNVSEN